MTEKPEEKTGKDLKRILVADDDPAILRLVQTILEKDNYSVVTARDGREAYKLLQRDTDFIAAIFDVVMPHISGPELVRYMKTEKRSDADPGDDDDCRAGSQAVVGQLCRGRGRLFAQAFYDGATTDNAANAYRQGWRLSEGW